METSILSLRRWWMEAPQTFDTVFNPRHNAIGFLRTVFAVAVIFSHSYTLGGLGAEIMVRFSHGAASIGGIAVYGFFTLSGFLITASFTHSPSVWRYLWHRFLRIMPAFWVALIVVAFVFAPLAYYLQNNSSSGFSIINTGGPLDYIINDFGLYMRQSGISGLIGSIPWPNAFDGSLWTLVYEVTGYFLVAAFGVFGIFKKHSRIVLGATLTLFGLYIMNQVLPGSASIIFPLFRDPQLLPLMLFFFAGSTWYLYSDKVPIRNQYFVLAAILYLLSLRYGFYTLVGPLTFIYCLFYLAARLPIRSFDRRLDLSYGIYIYAFPVQQTLAQLHVQNAGLLLYSLASLCVTLPLALASYYLVERPALKLKNIQLKPLVYTAGIKIKQYLTTGDY